jgi:putative PIN family toxin of toxin-antitoxin system
MRIVLDINVLLIALPVGKKYRPIFDALKNGKYILLISNEILAEYEEKISKKTKPEIAYNVIRMLLNLPNVESVHNIYYRWNLIANDPDDNKYTDCALAANASFVVSDDADFRILKKIPFPALKLLTSDEFLEILSSEGALHT